MRFLWCSREAQFIREEKQHKYKLFGPDFPRTFLTLTPECPGVKKFLPTTGATGKRTFWCGRPRFSAWTSMTRRVVEKLCTKKVCVDFLAPSLVGIDVDSHWLQKSLDQLRRLSKRPKMTFPLWQARISWCRCKAAKSNRLTANSNHHGYHRDIIMQTSAH